MLKINFQLEKVQKIVKPKKIQFKTPTFSMMTEMKKDMKLRVKLVKGTEAFLTKSLSINTNEFYAIKQYSPNFQKENERN